MAQKTRIQPMIKTELVEEFTAIADKMFWPFPVAIEIAMELFIKQYSQHQLPGFATPEPSPEMEKC